MTVIYGRYAHDYRRKGYSPLPLPAGKKFPPPTGWTGEHAYMASGSDIQFWIDDAEYPDDANIALRLPDGVIGIDLDDYNGKTGATTFARAAELIGSRPPSSGKMTSRDPKGHSGIRLFRVPVGTKLAGNFAGAGLGPDIDIIQSGHRYCVGPGSIHPEGGTYTWYDRTPSGWIEGEIPAVADLPELPDEWVEALQLKKPESREEIPHDAYDEMSPELREHVDAYVERAVERGLDSLEALKRLDTDQKDADGLGWELGTLEYTRALGALVKADWNNLQMEDLRERIVAALPSDASFSLGAGWSKFHRAVEGERVPPRAWPDTLEDARQEIDNPWWVEGTYRQVGFREAAGSEEAPAAEEVTVEEDPNDWPKEAWNEEGHVERTKRWAVGAYRWLADEQTWVRYNGVHWERDPRAGAKAVRAAMKAARWTELANYDATPKVDDKTGEVKPESSERDKFIKAMSDQSTDRMFNSAARVLSTEPEIETESSAFDNVEHLLGVANGVIDLRTGELIAGTPDQMISFSSPVAYDPDAKAPRFLEYLAESLPSEDVRLYLQRVIGYSMTGSTVEQALFMHYGEATNNGKSVLMYLVEEMLGSYTGVADPKALIESRNDQHTTHIAGLDGPRVLMMSETARGARLSDTLVKQITGGDRITARKIAKDGENYRIIGKIHMATNHLPHIVSSKSTNRRIHVIPWPVQIDNDKIDLSLREKLAARELPGILAWAVRGAVEWYAELERSQTRKDGSRPTGLGMPVEVRAATDEYLGEEDQVAQWLADRTEQPEEGQTVALESSSNLYQNYRSWAEQRGDRPMTQTALSLSLKKDHGFKPDRNTQHRGFYIQLKPIQQRWVT